MAGLLSPVLALALLACAAAPRAARADGQCGQVPYVAGADQSPSSEASWGYCTGAIEAQFRAQSHWCTKPVPLGTWPAPPSDGAKKCLKFGRSTIYRGPIYGSSPGHLAACNKRLKGDDGAALVAVSTKYLKTYQGGWAGDKGACDKCVCVRLHGGDDKYNPGIQKDNVAPALGLTFKGVVADRCSECEDDHIDLLQDRPLSFAPFNPDWGDNYNAPYVNAKDGLRGLADVGAIRGGAKALETAGTLTVDWQFVPCSYTHDQCATLMRSMGYDNVWTPKRSEGVDSFSLRPISTQRGASGATYDRLFKEPWT